ncbi:MAG: ComEC/Rec2 family competence protein [PVC group bacterium]
MKIISCILLWIFFLLPTIRAEDNSALELHFIDVGYGDAILIKSPSGRFALIDTGYPEAAGRVSAYLRERNVETLDHLIITHPHPDHLGGAAGLLKQFRVEQIYDNGQKIDQFDERLTVSRGREYERSVRERESYRVLKAGDTIQWDGVSLEVLWPPDTRAGRDWNANSLSIMLCYDGFRAFLAADNNTVSEQELLKKGEQALKAGLLKVGHHDAGDATGPAFLRAVSPRWAVVSVGESPWNYPSPAVLRRLEGQCERVFRTDRDGNIIVMILPSGEIRTIKTSRSSVPVWHCIDTGSGIVQN